MLSVPPDQDLQLVHKIFATILPLETPLPDMSWTSEAVDALYWGCTLPVPCREETVTLPLPSVYKMNMLEPAICIEPEPSETHE